MATRDDRVEIQSSQRVDVRRTLHPQQMAKSPIEKSERLISEAIEKQLSHTTSSRFLGDRRTNLSDPNSWSIFKVPRRLRQVNNNAYEPRLISIGPYFHGKEHLEKMEIFKKSSLSRIIGENQEMAEAFVTAMIDMKDDVRKCYPEALPYSIEESYEFVKMMILDGCFMVDLFQSENPSENFFGLNGILTDIYCDLLLLENQLPFSVPFKLYVMTKNVPNVEMNEFARLAVGHLSAVMPAVHGSQSDRLPERFQGNINSPQNFKHLLGLVHDSWIPQGTTAQGRNRSSNFIRCARELEEAGIKFVKKDIENGLASTLFDIDFTDDAKLEIPTLNIDDNTELILRNFMAYEQFIPISEPTYVCDYVVFMDNLIDSGKDVQLLRHSEVIVNWLGDDVAVAEMFNKLRNFVYSTKVTEHSFYYKKIYDEVNDHCEKPWNEWKAKLKQDYFNSPWSIISVAAAIVLLLFTVAQTIFSVLSYVHTK